MSDLYVESSAVLAWLLGEARSKEALARINEADTVVTSVLTVLETERALIRAERQNLLKAVEGRRLRGLFAGAARSWVLMEISEDVRAGAARAFPVEPVRTLDAIHLSTALLFVEALPDLKILTFDQRIGENAQALGIGLKTRKRR